MIKKKAKKSPLSKCSVESEDSGLGLKIFDIFNQKWRKDGMIGSLRPNFTKGSRSGFAVSGQMITTNTPAKPTERDSETGSLLKETSETSRPIQYLNMTFLQRDFPASLFPLRENARVFKTKQGELFSTKSAELLELKDQATYSLRMLKDYFLTTQAEPSQLYSFRWMSLGMMSNGRCLTLNIGCPKTGKGSLSSVLEDEVDERYYLSKKAIKFLERRNIDNKKAGRGFKADIQAGNKEAKTIDARYGALRNAGETLIIQCGHRTKGKPRFYKDQIPAMAQDYGTGGQNVPLILQIARGKNKGGIKEKISPSLSASDFEHNNLLIANTVDRDGYLRRGERDRDENGKAILTSIPKRRIRRLTPRECERLQGFPDDWTRVPAIGNDARIKIASHPEDEDEIIRGKIMSDTQRYKMMGNSVSIPVIEAIGKAILEILQ